MPASIAARDNDATASSLGTLGGGVDGAGPFIVGGGAGVGVVRSAGTAGGEGTAIDEAGTVIAGVAETPGCGSVPEQPVRASIATMLTQARLGRASVHTQKV